MKLHVATALSALLASGALLVACGGSDFDPVSVNDAWARTTAPSQTTGAVYATIVSEEDDKLLSVAVPSDVAAKAELHETVTADDQDEASDDMGSMDHGEHMDHGDGDVHGSMMMRQVSEIKLDAGKPLSLEPGGFHIMLIDLAGPIETGTEVPVTLTFESGGTLEVNAVAKDN